MYMYYMVWDGVVVDEASHSVNIFFLVMTHVKQQPTTTHNNNNNNNNQHHIKSRM